MKLVFYELKKVFSKKAFIILLALCLILNAAIFYYVQQNSDNRIYIKSDYPQLAREYGTLDRGEARQKLNDEALAYEILALINRASYAESDEEMDGVLESLAQYKTENPEAYAAAEKMSNDSGYNQNRESYIYTLSRQLDYIDGYPEFIDGMYERAREQSSFSIFSNKNEFSYKNLYKTAADYEHLSDISLTVGNDLPVNAAMEYNISDWLVIALIFLACVYLFNQEQEQGLYNLVRCTKNGRFKTAAAKLSGLFIVAAVITAVFELSNFAVSVYLYGGFDLGRSVQSMAEFRNCVFKINIGQLCLAEALVKAAGMIALSALFATLFVCVSGSGIKYTVSMLIAGGEYLLFCLVPESPLLGWLKYINIFYLFDRGFFASYLNLNFFSAPVTAYKAAAAALAFIFIVCAALTLSVFTLKSRQKQDSRLSSLTERFKSKHFKINGSTKIISGEVYKYLVLNKGALILIALIIFAVFSSTGKVNYPYYSTSDPAYKEYMEYLQGDITEEKENFLKSEQEYFDGLYKRLEEIENDESLSESTRGVAENTINNILETKGAAFERVGGQHSRLLELKESGVNARFIDENLYPPFVFSAEREWTNFTLALALLIISLPMLFTVEYKKKMINLVGCTPRGKLRLFLNKVALCLGVTVVTFGAVYLPYLVKFITTYGAESLSTPIVCMSAYENASGNITVLGAFVLTAVCYFALCLFAGAVILIISVGVKSHMLAMIISTVALIIPCIILYPYAFARVGAIYGGGCTLPAVIIISASLLLAIGCTALAYIKFTNAKFRRRKNANT